MGYVLCINNFPDIRQLTIGKIYKVLGDRGGFTGDKVIMIRNDLKVICGYFEYRFVPVKSNKINKLLYKELK